MKPFRLRSNGPKTTSAKKRMESSPLDIWKLLSSRDLISGVKNKKQTCGKPLKGGFSPHLHMNQEITPKQTGINPDQTVLMPKGIVVIKNRIRLPTKRGWAAMKVAELFKAQRTLRQLCRDHGAPLHLARHYLYQNKTK